MHQKIRYLSHPQVLIDPTKDIQNWSLNDVGKSRADTLANSGALSDTRVIISSAETKAVETARPLANAIGCALQIHTKMHENDRSATGYLPPDEFETVADQFFAYPDKSARGWETAIAAQSRIVDEIRKCLRVHTVGDILFVGHGGVGTLLFCYLSGLPISRDYDQGTGGGGCFFEFSSLKSSPITRWHQWRN